MVCKTSSMYFCSVNEDDRCKHSVFLILAEDGYDNETGLQVLDKVVQKFWSIIDPEQAQKRDLTPFQYSEIMKQELKAIAVGVV